MHEEHQNFGMTKVVGYNTVYCCLSKITSSILAVFSNNYVRIEVLLNPCEINQDRRVWNTILRLHPCHILNVLGSNSKGPMERSKGNNILNTNDPMPRNERKKADKSQ